MGLWDSFKDTVNKTWSGADFWDEEENKKQRDLFTVDREQRGQITNAPSEYGAVTDYSTGTPEFAEGTKFNLVTGPDGQTSFQAVDTYGQLREQAEQAIPENRYRDWSYDPEGKNKTIFGWNAAALLPQQYEKTYSAGTGQDYEASQEQFLQNYDKLQNEQFRNAYVQQLIEQAQDKPDEHGVITPGDPTAKNTLEALRQNGRLQGDAMDFVEGSNERLFGGLSRGLARTVDFVLPGENTLGLEEWADKDDNQRQVTDWGKRGETFGTVQKGLVDTAALVVPTVATENALKGTRFIQGLRQGNAAQRAVAFAGPNLASDLTLGTAIEGAQEIGRGNEFDIKSSMATAAAAGIVLPVVLRGASKAIGGKNQIDNVINKTPEEITVNVGWSDDLASTGIKRDITKIELDNLKYGSDTLGTDIDEATVFRYVDDIKAGKPIDPLVVTKEGDNIYLQDGKHRMEALRILGREEVPVVYRDAPVKEVVEEGYMKLDDGSVVKAPKANSTKQIGDLLDMDRFQKKAVTKNADKLLAEQYGVAEDTVRRLRNGYGDETARNLLARTSDATNIRDMDAFVISEARKQYGSPNVRINRGVKQVEAPKPVTEAPKKVVSAPDSELGSMVDNFYEARKGVDEKIGFRALEDLGKKVARQVDDDLAKIGSNYDTVARKVQKGAREGAETLEKAGLSPEEATVLRKAQAEMRAIRRRASLGNKAVGEGDFGEMYLPQQKLGQYEGDKLYKGFIDKKPGNEFTRTNAIDLAELDYSPDTIGQYITRYGDTRAYKQQRIFNAFKRANPNVDEEQLSKATQQMVDLQDKVNNLKTKVGLGGAGRRTTKADGKIIDSVDELNKIGKELGLEQIEITDLPKGLTNGDKINSIVVDLNTDKTLGDFIGLNQYRDAGNYASSQGLNAAGDRKALARMVEQRLVSEYNIDDDSLEYIIGGINRMAKDLPEEVVTARVLSTYRMAAKQQMLDQLQRLDIKSPKLRKVVSDLTNQILREGTIERELSAKLTSNVLKTQNAIFRKLNVSSAMNELGDLPSFLSVYGKDFTPAPDFRLIKQFGLGDIDAAIEPYIKQIDQGKSLKSVLGSINSKTNLYRFVEAYKAGVVANSASKFYTSQGLQGDALVKAVLDDYRKIALPVDAFTKTFLDSAPLYTQYMTWGARNLQKEGLLALGKMDAGKLANMSTAQRVARNAYVNLPAKTVWWLASNGLKGTSILTAFGLTDFTGLTQGDYSGIAEEDKSLFDKTTEITNASTTLSILNNIVQSVEKEQLKNKYNEEGADYNTYENHDWDGDIIDIFRPQAEKNFTRTQDMMNKGYSENKAGRVQYEAPEDFWNIAKSYVFGKNQTQNSRDYSGRKNIADRVSEGQNPLTAIKDMALEQINVQDTDYNRPISDKYSEAYKEIDKTDKEARTAMLEGGKQYNDYLDDLRKDSPERYDAYIKSMDGNHVNPEYWKRIYEGGDGKPSLETFNMIKNRKKQFAKDHNVAYDPLYDLNDEQARAVLQQKSVATGDDLDLRNNLYKEGWYKDYQNKVREYYENREDVPDSDYEQTQRVKDWYEINDQFNSLRFADEEEVPEWAERYPLIYQQKIINNKYGFGSDESSAWFKANGDGYRTEKVGYDAENLELINKMREIEGYPPMGEEQYQQATAIENTDSDSNSWGSGRRGSSGSSGSVRVTPGSFGRKKTLNLPSGKIKVAKVSSKGAYKPKAVKIKRNKNYK